MYPYSIIGDVDLYAIFLCVGVVAAVLTVRIFCDKKKIYWKLQNFCVFSAVAAVLLGYFSAVLFQALYNIKERGEFIIDTATGATFYGGLIGGTATFLLIYFGVGHFLFKKAKQNVKSFFTVADIAAAAIAVAHGFGRIGCLMSGCCHGAITDAWYGIYMHNLKAKAVPLQLYEALFLFALFGFFVYRLIKNKSCNLPLYMAIYGAWRFVIEFFRDDNRGSTFVDFLSPSQLIALIMIIGAVTLYFGQKYAMKRQALSTQANEDIDREEIENEE